MENKQKILIADNDAGFGTGIRKAFSGKYDIIVVTNKSQAQEAVWAQRPDAVMIGTLMPRGDAFLLHQWLKQTAQFRDLPIVVVDAEAEKQLLAGWTRYEGMVLDADDYVMKPIEPRALVPRVAKLLDKSTRRIKVLVVDDHAIVREGIRALLALQKDMQVIGEAVNGQEALEKTFELSPDVVLMDVVMPVMNGLEATKRICSKWDKARILMLSQYDDDENVLASNQAGALGFVPKRSAGAELLDGIRSVSQGKPFIHTVAA